MKKLILGLLALGMSSSMYSQGITLPEVEISVLNYKYLNSVNSEDIDSNVKKLEKEVAYYDYDNSDFYSYDVVAFYIPKGKILATYDSEGNIFTTTEKFDNIKLPTDVRDAIFTRFPGWSLKKNAYRVIYKREKSRKEYRVVIQNGDELLRVKTDEKGNFVGKNIIGINQIH